MENIMNFEIFYKKCIGGSYNLAYNVYKMVIFYKMVNLWNNTRLNQVGGYSAWTEERSCD